MTQSRDANLDLLRALAIIGVLAYHIHGMWPTTYCNLECIAHLGQYGVTLFFVLSGWLIGTIFWRDRDLHQNFSVVNFWVRRWFRTVPPYLAGMTLGYLAVRFGRDEPFDIRYLYFGQNYSDEIRFYLISWSLCVEEHFYLFLPLVGSIALRLPNRFALILLWTLPFLPPLLRFLDPSVVWPSHFGYSRTATHLAAEGLALGVASAFTFRHFPVQWSTLQTAAKRLTFPTLALFISVSFWNSQVEFFIGQTVVSLCCFVWLAAVARQRPLPFATNPLVYAIAISSYSVYLTHSLAIHVSLRLARPSGELLSEIVCLAIWILIIAAGGAAFYYSIERSSIKLRDYASRWIVNRMGSKPSYTRMPPRRVAERFQKNDQLPPDR